MPGIISSLAILIPFLLGAHATPIEAPAAAPTTYCANFDDLAQNSAGFDPTTNPVGTYKGITYTGFVVATQKNAANKYFTIPSPPNAIRSGTISQNLYGGTAALRLNATALGNNPHATFTLSTLRLACLVTNGQFTSNANGCTVLFVGNIKDGGTSVVYEYEYPNQITNPGPGTPVTPFGRVTLPGNFKGLDEVFMTTTNVQNGVIGVDLLLDDVCLSIPQ